MIEARRQPPVRAGALRRAGGFRHAHAGRRPLRRDAGRADRGRRPHPRRRAPSSPTTSARSARSCKRWIADPEIDVVITTGGTGFTGRDVTPEAVEPLFDKRMEGFAAVFHRISYDKIGTSTIQSRATAGLAERHLHLLPAGLARRLPRRLGRHPRPAVRLPPGAVQFRRDHAAPRRAPETDEAAESAGTEARTRKRQRRRVLRDQPSRRSRRAVRRRKPAPSRRGDDAARQPRCRRAAMEARRRAACSLRRRPCAPIDERRSASACQPGAQRVARRRQEQSQSPRARSAAARRTRGRRRRARRRRSCSRRRRRRRACRRSSRGRRRSPRGRRPRSPPARARPARGPARTSSSRVSMITRDHGAFLARIAPACRPEIPYAARQCVICS